MRVCSNLLGRSYVVVLECEEVADCDVYNEVQYEGREDALNSRDDWEEPLTPEDGVNDGWAGN